MVRREKLKEALVLCQGRVLEREGSLSVGAVDSEALLQLELLRQS